MKDEWDLFISHASEDKDSFVRPLAKALEEAGLSVWYDEHTLTLGDSLRREIDSGLANSRYGVVVLSHSFFAKDWPQAELDGLVAREIGGRKVILPVWHRITRDEVARYSPLLAGRLAASSDRGLPYVVSEIQRVIAGQERGPAPDLTKTVSVQSFDSLVLLVAFQEGGTPVFCESKDISHQGDLLTLKLIAAKSSDTALLRKLRTVRTDVGVAYGLTGLLGKIRNVEERRQGPEEIWTVTLATLENDYGSTTEFGTTGISADDFAIIRARRILLNEQGAGTTEGTSNSAFMDSLVLGMGPIKVRESPLPQLYRAIGDQEFFLAAAKLTAVLFLRGSGVIEDVFKLDLAMEAPGILNVDFEGQRRRKYSNVDPPVIRVRGQCRLTLTSNRVS